MCDSGADGAAGCDASGGFGRENSTVRIGTFVTWSAIAIAVPASETTPKKTVRANATG